MSDVSDKVEAGVVGGTPAGEGDTTESSNPRPMQEEECEAIQHTVRLERLTEGETDTTSDPVNITEGESDIKAALMVQQQANMSDSFATEALHERVHQGLTTEATNTVVAKDSSSEDVLQQTEQLEKEGQEHENTVEMESNETDKNESWADRSLREEAEEERRRIMATGEKSDTTDTSGESVNVGAVMGDESRGQVIALESQTGSRANSPSPEKVGADNVGRQVDGAGTGVGSPKLDKDKQVSSPNARQGGGDVIREDDGEVWNMDTAMVSGQYCLPMTPLRSALTHRDPAVRNLFYLSLTHPYAATRQFCLISGTGEACIRAPAGSPPGTVEKFAKDHKNTVYYYWDGSRLYCVFGRPVMVVIPDGRWFMLHSTSGPWDSDATFVDKLMGLLEDWESFVVVKVDFPAMYPNIDLYDSRTIKSTPVAKDRQTLPVDKKTFEENFMGESCMICIPWKYNKWHADMELETRLMFNCPVGRSKVHWSCTEEVRTKEQVQAILDAEKKLTSTPIVAGASVALFDAAEESMETDEVEKDQSPKEQGPEDASGEQPASELIEETEGKDQADSNVEMEEVDSMKDVASDEEDGNSIGGESEHGGSAKKVKKGCTLQEIMAKRPSDSESKRRWKAPSERIQAKNWDYNDYDSYDEQYYDYLKKKKFPVKDYPHLVGNHVDIIWKDRDMTTCTPYKDGMTCPIPDCQLAGKKYNSRLAIWSHWRAFHIDGGASFVKCGGCDYFCAKFSDHKKHVISCYKSQDRRANRDWANLTGKDRDNFLKNPSEEFMDLLEKRSKPHWFPMLAAAHQVYPEVSNYIKDSRGRNKLKSGVMKHWIWLCPDQKDPRLPLKEKFMGCCPRPVSDDWSICEASGYKSYEDMIKMGLEPSDLFDREWGDVKVPTTGRSRASRSQGNERSAVRRGRSTSLGRDNVPPKRPRRDRSGDRRDRDRDDDDGDTSFKKVDKRKDRKSAEDEFGEKKEEGKGVKPTPTFDPEMETPQLVAYVAERARLRGTTVTMAAMQLHKELEAAIWLNWNFYERSVLERSLRLRVATMVKNLRIVKHMVKYVYSLFQPGQAPTVKMEVDRKWGWDSMSAREQDVDSLKTIFAHKPMTMEELDWDTFPCEFPGQPELVKSWNRAHKLQYVKYTAKSYQEKQDFKNRKRAEREKEKIEREKSGKDKSDTRKSAPRSRGNSESDRDDRSRDRRSRSTSELRRMDSDRTIEKSSARDDRSFSEVTGGVSPVRPQSSRPDTPTSPGMIADRAAAAAAMTVPPPVSRVATAMNSSVGAHDKDPYRPRINMDVVGLASVRRIDLGGTRENWNFGANLAQDARDQGTSCFQALRDYGRQSYNLQTNMVYVLLGAYENEVQDNQANKERVKRLLETQKTNLEINTRLKEDNEKLATENKKLSEEAASLQTSLQKLNDTLAGYRRQVDALQQSNAELEKSADKSRVGIVKSPFRPKGSPAAVSSPGATQTGKFNDDPQKWTRGQRQLMCESLGAMVLSEPENNTVHDEGARLEIQPSTVPLFRPNDYLWVKTSGGPSKKKQSLQKMVDATKQWADYWEIPLPKEDEDL